MLLQGCVLRVGVLGINFKTAELALRESIAKGAQSLAGEKGIFFPHPTVLLSTCNRTEIYFSGDDLAQVHSNLLAWLRSHIEEPFEHRLYSYFGMDCFAHLCRVASGLDSAILAETEIQRQVRISYAKGCEILRLPSCLHYIFQKSFKVAKAIRSQIPLQRGGPTLFGTLWEIAEEILGKVESRRLLLVGYSEIHRGFASFLIKKGVKNLTFCTKSPEKVREVRACGRDELRNWNHYDLISCASQAPDFLIRGQGKERHLIFDLSVPRNVDPSVGRGEVSLFNIEQIDHLIEQKKFSHGECLEKTEEFLWDSVCRLSRIYRNKMERSELIASFK